MLYFSLLYLKLHNPSVIIIITRTLPSCQANKQEKDGKDGAGPSPITAQLMFQAMGVSPGGSYPSGNANRVDSKDQNDHQLLTKDHDKKHHETDNG